MNGLQIGAQGCNSLEILVTFCKGQRRNKAWQLLSDLSNADTRQPRPITIPRLPKIPCAMLQKLAVCARRLSSH